VDTETRFVAPLPLPPAQPIRLGIAGADLLLAGRFEQWVPLVMADGASDESAVQLLVDVTSPPGQGGPRPSADLFSFTAKKVEQVAPNAHRARGVLRANGHSRATEVLLHSPVGHTPFLLATFQIERSRFPELWEALEERALSAAASGTKEMRPRAWLRLPDLAAA
jgi:hypothetical protein